MASYFQNPLKLRPPSSFSSQNLYLVKANLKKNCKAINTYITSVASPIFDKLNLFFFRVHNKLEKAQKIIKERFDHTTHYLKSPKDHPGLQKAKESFNLVKKENPLEKTQIPPKQHPALIETEKKLNRASDFYLEALFPNQPNLSLFFDHLDEVLDVTDKPSLTTFVSTILTRIALNKVFDRFNQKLGEKPTTNPAVEYSDETLLEEESPEAYQARSFFKLAKDYSIEALAKVYRKEALVSHPDRFQEPSDKAIAKDFFQKITSMKAVLEYRLTTSCCTKKILSIKDA